MADYDDNVQTFTETVPTGSKTALELRRRIAQWVFRLGLDSARDCGMSKAQERQLATEDTLTKVEGILFQELDDTIEVVWQSPLDVDGTPETWWTANDLNAVLEDSSRWRERDAEDFVCGLYLETLGKHRPMSEVEILEFMGMGFEEEDAVEVEVLDETEKGHVLYQIPGDGYAIKNELGTVTGFGAFDAMERWQQHKMESPRTLPRRVRSPPDKPSPLRGTGSVPSLFPPQEERASPLGTPVGGVGFAAAGPFQRGALITTTLLKENG